MGRPTALTKLQLIKWGVTEITPDGHIFIGDYEKSWTLNTKKTRFGTKSYYTIQFYDSDYYFEQKEKHPDKERVTGQRFYTLARVIWAWYNNYCPANMDVDHINNDPLDNRLENLQLLTRKQNLEKRFKDNPDNNCNQYGKKAE